ncbi:hypothetical protein DBW_0202 [Desulfuromonas sp. DDH964]|jgi:hypothetical protein|nr:hypothetical protein [Desulfuromonas sp. DDH964]AMV70602.1 hypothetical protein DBW_0202 [Desulfuromonas sp. DDH964]
MNPTLTDILWYLAIGAFFIMMMRKGGCCGGHKKEQKQEINENKVEHKH